MNLAQFIHQLHERGCQPVANPAGGFRARCPAHDDRNPSLSIKEGDDGRILVHCHAGCTAGQVMAALGLTEANLFASPSSSAISVPAVPVADRGGDNGDSGDAVTGDNGRLFATADDAVRWLESRLGNRSAWWTYHDAAGNPVGVVVRFDTPTGKTLRPVSLAGGGWVIGAMPEPRPLYQLPTLAAVDRVLVVEGEKCAEVARSLGFTATTSAGGARAAAKADWSCLAGKQVVILPDNDDAGDEYADDVVAQLARLSPSPTVKLVELPDLAEGGDIADFVAARRRAGASEESIRAEIESLIAAAPVHPLQPPTSGLVTPPFPMEALPAAVREFVEVVSRSMQCPPAFVALPALAASAAAIGNAHRLQLKSGYVVPPILWTVVVGEPGTVKSPAFQAALRPILREQSRRFAEAEAQAPGYAERHARYEQALAEWKKNPAGDMPVPPEEPKPERFVTSDTTIEALAAILADNPRGLLLAPEELDSWFQSFERYSTGSNQPQWLTLYDGGTLIIDRKTGKPRTLHVHSAAVCLAGTIQPGVLIRSLGQREREGGLASRLLFTMDTPPKKVWTMEGIPAAVEDRYAGVLATLRSLPLTLEHGEVRPVVLRLDDEAQRLFIEFFDRHNEELSQLHGDLAAAWSKLEAIAGRLALVIHLVRQACGEPVDPNHVDATSMIMSLKLVEYFKGQACRVYAMVERGTVQRSRQSLVDWIRDRGGSCTVRELTHGNRRYRGRSRQAREDLELLVSEGVGDWITETASNRRRVKRFRLHRAGLPVPDVALPPAPPPIPSIDPVTLQGPRSSAETPIVGEATRLPVIPPNAAVDPPPPDDPGIAVDDAKPTSPDDGDVDGWEEV